MADDHEEEIPRSSLEEQNDVAEIHSVLNKKKEYQADKVIKRLHCYKWIQYKKLKSRAKIQCI